MARSACCLRLVQRPAAGLAQRTSALLGASLLGTSLLAGAATPAYAAPVDPPQYVSGSPNASIPPTVFTWNFNGTFGNSQGPLRKGSFVGTMSWDTTANAWSYWDILTYSQGEQNQANFGGRLSSRSTTDIANPWDPSTLGLNSGAAANSSAFCFASPLAKGNAAAGPYAQSGPGGTACDGTNGNQDPAMTYLAVGDEQAGAFKQQGNNTVSTNFKYFRIQFVPSPDGDESKLALIDYNPGSAQSREWIGLSYLKNAASGPDCLGNNSYPQAAGVNYCPYSGNTQGQTGLSTVALYPGGETPPDPGPVPDDVPAPLPLFGAGLAFGWSRRIRRRVKRGPVQAPVAMVG